MNKNSYRQLNSRYDILSYKLLKYGNEMFLCFIDYENSFNLDNYEKMNPLNKKEQFINIK